jgi:hypothetical protein
MLTAGRKQLQHAQIPHFPANPFHTESIEIFPLHPRSPGNTEY